MILDKTQTREFPISGILVKSLINKSCYNSRASNDINIKLGPVTKIGKTNATTSKNFDDDVLSADCDVIVIFTINN